MKKMFLDFVRKNANSISAIALFAATFVINTRCTFHYYDCDIPEAAKKLRRF